MDFIIWLQIKVLHFQISHFIYTKLYFTQVYIVGPSLCFLLSYDNDNVVIVDDIKL